MHRLGTCFLHASTTMHCCLGSGTITVRRRRPRVHAKIGECMPARAPPFPAAAVPSSTCLGRLLVTLTNFLLAVLTYCTHSQGHGLCGSADACSGLHPCDSVMLQMEALGFAYVDHALHAVHRRGRGGSEALDGLRGPHCASLSVCVTFWPELRFGTSMESREGSTSRAWLTS